MGGRLAKLGAYVRYAPFPQCVEAVTLPNNDGTFDIYVNDCLSPCKQKKALEHELNHIERNHFYNDKAEIQFIEQEADLAVIQ